MIRKDLFLHKFVAVLVSALAGGVINSGWAQTPAVPDGVVQTAIYFPMPFVTYNSIYLGKKLDIGITEPFIVNLGSPECAGKNSFVGTGAELPSLWLPNMNTSGNQVVATPLIVRSQKPNEAVLPGHLNVSGLNAPIFIRELEVGKRSSTGTQENADFKLLGTENSMGNPQITVENLALGDATVAPANVPELPSLTVTGTSNVNLRMGNSISDPIIGAEIPACPDGIVSWKKLKFGGIDRIALVCGVDVKEAFNSGYECLPNPGTFLQCDVSNNDYYCSTEGCSPAPAFKWRKGSRFSWNLTGPKHKNYCDWLNKNSGATEDQKKDQLIALTRNSSLTECSGGVPSTTWQSMPNDNPGGASNCIYIRRDLISPSSISCAQADINNVHPGAVSYDEYTRDLFTLGECQNYCDSFD